MGKRTDHSHAVQLLQRRHCLQNENNKPSSFYGFYRAREQIWRDSLEVLKHAHSIRVTENLVGFFVVSVQ